MVLVCGLEEAGRGPLIGPLIMAGVMLKEEDTAKLERIKVKDSKLLTPKKREELFKKIIKIVDNYIILKITPEEVDEALESDSLNLNWLEAVKSSEIINALNPEKVLLDCPSNNTRAYANYVMKGLKNKNIEVIAEHKADEKYPIVAAASILAKVTRDEEIRKIEKKLGMRIGSGYPADPITKKFIEEHYESHPEIFRKTWITYKKLVGGKNQRKLSEF